MRLQHVLKICKLGIVQIRFFHEYLLGFHEIQFSSFIDGHVDGLHNWTLERLQGDGQVVNVQLLPLICYVVEYVGKGFHGFQSLLVLLFHFIVFYQLLDHVAHKNWRLFWVDVRVLHYNLCHKRISVICRPQSLFIDLGRVEFGFLLGKLLLLNAG